MSDKVNIALVGLGFGAEFIPIYLKHPNANIVAICQRNEVSLNEIGEKYGIEKRYTSYEELLADPDVDAVHINTPIGSHGPHSIQALKAGKHVACTVPMATTVEECKTICDLRKVTGLTYMMMETVVYSREFCSLRSSSIMASSDGFNTCSRVTNKTWQAGRAIGTDCRRCIMRRIALDRCWRCNAIGPKLCLVLVRGVSRKR